MTEKEEIKNGLSEPVDVTASGMHIVLPSTGQVADNPLSADKTKPSATYQNLVVSPDNKLIIDADTGDYAENPLNIQDPVKRDNVNVMQRTTSVWVAHVIVLSVFYFNAYSQLWAEPKGNYMPPVEFWGFVLGIYGASSMNFVSKIMAVKDSLIKRKE